MKLDEEIIAKFQLCQSIEEAVKHIETEDTSEDGHSRYNHSQLKLQYSEYIYQYILRPIPENDAKVLTISLLIAQKRLIEEDLKAKGIEV